MTSQISDQTIRIRSDFMNYDVMSKAYRCVNKKFDLKKT